MVPVQIQQWVLPPSGVELLGTSTISALNIYWYFFSLQNTHL